METSVDDYLTPRHRTLRLIANAAGVLAYVALAFFVLQAVGVAFSAIYQQRLTPFNLIDPQQASALRYLNLALNFLSRVLNAAIFWVLLTGLSLGLRMIIETDVNYRTDLIETDAAEADNG